MATDLILRDRRHSAGTAALHRGDRLEGCVPRASVWLQTQRPGRKQAAQLDARQGVRAVSGQYAVFRYCVEPI